MLAPLDDDHAARLEHLVDIEEADVRLRAEPVEVDVVQDAWRRRDRRGGARRSGIRTTAGSMPIPVAMPAHQDRLAGAELAAQEDEVAGLRRACRCARRAPGCPSRSRSARRRAIRCSREVPRAGVRGGDASLPRDRGRRRRRPRADAPRRVSGARSAGHDSSSAPTAVSGQGRDELEVLAATDRQVRPRRPEVRSPAPPRPAAGRARSRRRTRTSR